VLGSQRFKDGIELLCKRQASSKGLAKLKMENNRADPHGANLSSEKTIKVFYIVSLRLESFILGE
jgi:hypothetical protein